MGILARGSALLAAAALFAAWLWPAAPQPIALPVDATASAAAAVQEAARMQAQEPAAAAPAGAEFTVLPAEPLEHVSGDDPLLRYALREDEGLQRRVVYAPDQATASNPFGAQDWGARGPTK
jgi:hypothetical protein